MDGLRQYVISVVSAALLCGIGVALTPKSAAGELLRLLCGVFLATTILGPIAGFDLDILAQLPQNGYSEAESVSGIGIKMAADARNEIIIAQTEAYILDKASLWNAQLQAKVNVDEEGLPAEVYLKGDASPYARQQLERILTSELGIAKENQVWSG